MNWPPNTSNFISHFKYKHPNILNDINKDNNKNININNEESNNNSNITQENDVQTEHQSFSSGRQKNNIGSIPSVGHSNLKNLQQDLQIALLKYKKTLQIFSSWKHNCFYKSNNNIYI